MSMLKTTMSSQVLIANEKLAAKEIDGVTGGDKSIKKCGKLLKTAKLSKFQKSVKSRKKLSKNRNLHNFDTEENGPSFLTPDTKTTFNYL